MKNNNTKYKLKVVTAILGVLSVCCGKVIAMPDEQSVIVSRTDRVDEKMRAQVQEAYGSLPLSFVGNRGQVDERALFYVKMIDHAVYVSRNGVILSLHDGDASTLVSMVPMGANKNPEIVGEQRLPGHVNYLVGNDANEWKTHIPTYQAVVYKEIYPGIDLKLYGSNRQLEYDFILKPGADPLVVALSLEGVHGVTILESGDLELVVGKEKIIGKRPVVYQDINGRRTEIAGKYKLLTQQGNGPQQYTYGQQYAYGFEVGVYDKSQPLVIDPILSYSTYLGGKRMDIAHAIAVDKLGYAYVGGRVVSDSNMDATPALDNFPGFPVTAGVVQPHHAEFMKLAADGFVSKFNLDGTGLVYSTYLGGAGDPQFNNPVNPKILGSIAWNQSGTDVVMGIAIDSDGNAYVAGQTSSHSFPTTAGAYQSAYNPGDCSAASNRMSCADAFVAKLNRDGSALLYSTHMGGSGDDHANGIVLDDAGNAYVTGFTASNNFPVTSGVVQRVRAGSCPMPDTEYKCIDAFVFKLDATGSSLAYSTLIGGSDNDQANGIALDARGNVYIAGSTRSTDFPTTRQAYKQLRGNGTGTAFVTKLSNNGTRLAYSTYLGGNNGVEGAKGIAVSAAGNAYVVGFTEASDFPVTSGVFGSVRHVGHADAFVTKLNKAGSALVYSTLLGGVARADALHGQTDVNTYGQAVAIDEMGNAYVIGMTNAADFPWVNAINPEVAGDGTFIAKINPAATAVLFSTQHKGGRGNAIAVDPRGDIYIAGNSSTDILPLVLPLQNAPAGGGDAFVAKIGMEEGVTAKQSSSAAGVVQARQQK